VENVENAGSTKVVVVAASTRVREPEQPGTGIRKVEFPGLGIDE
jgi:hypothetical protein